MKDIIKLNSLNSLDFQTKGFNAEINVIPGDELRCEIDSSDENKPKIEKSESGDTNYLYINYNDDGFLNNIFGFNFITRKNIKVKELSEQTGISESTISRIENGVIKNPGILTLIKLANTLNVSLENLILYENNNSENEVCNKTEEKEDKNAQLY